MSNKNHYNIIPDLLKLTIVSSLLFSSAVHLSAATITPQDIVKRVNDIRAEHARVPLQENHLLTLAAYNKANDMREDHYFAHRAPGGKEFYEWIADAGYAYTFAGENLAKDFRSPDDLITAWMESPTHRANILDADFCEIGVAQLTDITGASLVVQMFGCRQNAPLVSRDRAHSNKQTSTSSGYTLANPQSLIVFTENAQTSRSAATNEPSGESGANRQKSERSRLLASGMLILFTVTVLSITQRRRHYHHIYKIPIKVNKS